MTVRAANWLLLLAAVASLAFLSGCATEEPENASVRPWAAPAGWQQNGMMGGMDYQRR
jgi:hypothetical protein